MPLAIIVFIMTYALLRLLRKAFQKRKGRC